MRPLLCAALLCFTVVPTFGAEEAKPNTLTKQEIADGWLLLFDGESAFGWNPHAACHTGPNCHAEYAPLPAPGNRAQCPDTASHVACGGGVALNNSADKEKTSNKERNAIFIL